MNKAYYSNMIRELGILNGIRFSVFNKVRHKMKIKRNYLWRIHINSLGRDVYIRPFTTDFDLIGDFFLNGAISRESKYQYDINFSDKLKKPAKYVIDAGANIGLFSVLYKKKFCGATIAAIEPEQGNYRLLLKNIKNLNGVKALRGGVWSKKCFLKINESKTGAWGFTVSECEQKDSDIFAFSIPDIMKKYKFPYIDILKMDIEGSEMEVFQDEKCLEWLKLVKVLIIETHDDKAAGCEGVVMDRMKLSGYVYEKAGEDFVFYRKTV